MIVSGNFRSLFFNIKGAHIVSLKSLKMVELLILKIN